MSRLTEGYRTLHSCNIDDSVVGTAQYGVEGDVARLAQVYGIICRISAKSVYNGVKRGAENLWREAS